MFGIQVFSTVAEAIRAGFQILSPYPDSEGFLHARARMADGWAIALVQNDRNSATGHEAAPIR